MVEVVVKNTVVTFSTCFIMNKISLGDWKDECVSGSLVNCWQVLSLLSAKTVYEDDTTGCFRKNLSSPKCSLKLQLRKILDYKFVGTLDGI